MVGVKWSDRAIDQVYTFAAYIAEDSLPAAEKWVEDILALTVQLSNFPESGRFTPELKKVDVREVIFEAYRVLYQYRGGVEVIGVYHGSQLLESQSILSGF